MKRFLIIGMTIALVAATALLAIGCSGISSTPPSITGGNISLSQQSTGIWVNGEGKVTAVPDIANLSVGVEAQFPTVAEAQSQAATSMDAVVKELKRLGVDEKDIKTQQYNIYPVWRYDKDQQILVGYRVANMVNVKIRKVADTGMIIDAVTKAGGNYTRINSISFAVNDPSTYLKQARELAMNDAQAKAKQLADLGGVRLGRITYIQESGSYNPPVPYPVMRDTAAAPAPVTPITPGETEIRLSVQVVYSIG